MSGRSNGRRPLVSICIPTLNRAKYLDIALKSALEQSFDNLEILVADNASTDGTSDLMSSVMDSRVRYLPSPVTVPLAENWTRTLKSAQGDYCLVLSDDDRLEPNLIERLVVPMQEDWSLDVAFADTWVMDEKGALCQECSRLLSLRFGRADLHAGRHARFVDLAIRDQSIPIAASLIRRNSLLSSGALNLVGGLVIDYYLMARLALKGGAAFFVPDRLASMRVHAGAGSSVRFSQACGDMQAACADLYRSIVATDEQRWLCGRWAESIGERLVADIRTDWRKALITAGKSTAAMPPGRRWPATAIVVKVLAARVMDRYRRRNSHR